MKRIKIAKIITLIAVGSFSAIAVLGAKSTKSNNTSQSKNNSLNALEDSTLIKTNDNPIAIIKVKDVGVMEFELYPSIAPNTVNNFIYLANSGFYNNLHFYKLIKNFCIQGGSPDNTPSGGPDYKIKGEFNSNNISNNLSHNIGTISMARFTDNDSAGSQFFITTTDCTNLDGNYAAFGRITKGIDILMSLNNYETNQLTYEPLTDIIIESVSVDTKGLTYLRPEKI